MNEFSVRFRVDLAPSCMLTSDVNVLALMETPDGLRVELIGDQGRGLANSSRLSLHVHGWSTVAAAEERGTRFADVFILALVRSKVGAESWARRGGGAYFDSWLRAVQEETGVHVLNDTVGLTIYKTNPPPVFQPFEPRVRRGVTAEKFIEAFRHVAAVRIDLSDRERIGIDLYNASFFEPAPDTRFIVLVVAIEALSARRPRSSGAVDLLKGFAHQVRASDLAENERGSIVGALEDLHLESIGSAARRLVRERLGDTEYAGEKAVRFFDTCYTLRGALVHDGDLRARREEVARLVEALDRFVSDLLVSRFFDPIVEKEKGDQ